jgi:hypothetical protein
LKVLEIENKNSRLGRLESLLILKDRQIERDTANLKNTSKTSTFRAKVLFREVI